MIRHAAPGFLPVEHADSARCRICDLTDPASPHYSAAYARLFSGQPLPMPLAAPTPPAGAGAAVTLPGGIPLAGDLVAGLTAALGIDRVVRWVARRAGTTCNCGQRQAALNRIDAAGRRLLARVARRDSA